MTGEIKAGAKSEDIQVLQPGQAAPIMTGAPAPPGADAVVMVEYTAQQGERVQITKSVAPGDNIVPIGSESRRGERLLSPGMRLDYAAIAVAASAGRSRLLVYRKPQVAVLATGDEIVDIDIPPAANQIRNSNSYSLAAQVQAVGGEPVLLPIAPDEPARLRELIAEHGGQSSLDLRHHSLGAIVAGDVFTAIERSWSAPTPADGKLRVCARVCGEADSYRAQFADADRIPGRVGPPVPGRDG